MRLLFPKKSKILAVLCTVLTIWALTVQGTTFFERPFPEVVQDAPVIARGKIGASHVKKATGLDREERIYTYYELQVEEVFKGATESRSTMIRELGGEKDGLGMVVAGASQFSFGEDVVVLLGEKNPDGSHDVRGLMMGKYNITRGADGKEYLTGAGITADAHLRNRQMHPEETGSQDDTSPNSKWSIDSLRQLLREQQGGPQDPKKSHENQKISPVPAVSPTGLSASQQAAPQLQPNQDGPDSATQAGKPDFATWILGGLAISSVALSIYLMRRKRG